MPIFSKKSRSGQSRSVDEKHNGQTYPQTSRHGVSPDSTMGQTVDPIVERMAIQAASRRRMNGEAPDYSITPAHRRTSSNATGISAPSTVHHERRSNRAGGGRAESASGSITPPSNSNRIEKSAREPNKSRKSSVTISLLSMETTPDGYAPQKARQANRRQDGPSHQLSTDSGYSSGARTSATTSPTQGDSTGSQESELLYRHRRINDSLAKKKAATQARTFSLPTSQVLNDDVKSPKTLSTHHKSEEKLGTAAAKYVSRLDPGSASVTFFASSIAPQISPPSTPQQLEESAQAVATFMEQEKARMASSIPAPTAEQSADRASRELPDSTREASISTTTRTTEKETAAATVDDSSHHPTLSKDDRVEQDTLDKGIEPSTETITKPVQQQNTVLRKPAPSKQSNPIASQDPVLTNPVSPVDATLRTSSLKMPRLPIVPPSQTPTATYETSKDSTPLVTTSSKASIQSASRPSEERSSPSGPQKPASIPIDTVDTQQSKNLPPQQKSVPQSSSPQTNVTTTTTTTSTFTNRQPTLPAKFPVPAPHVEFPYLAGIEKDAKLSSVSVLEGFKVNRRGQVLDEEGDLIGELVTGEIIHCVRRKVNAKGQVVDESGKIVGQTRAVAQAPTLSAPPSKPKGLDSGHDQRLTNSPISPATPRQRRKSNFSYRSIQSNAQQVNVATERGSNHANDNTVYFELDASAESEAVPVIDHSEIFSPFAASHSRSSGGQPATQSSVRIQPNVSAPGGTKSNSSAAGIETPARGTMQGVHKRSDPPYRSSVKSPLSGAGRRRKEHKTRPHTDQNTAHSPPSSAHVEALANFEQQRTASNTPKTQTSPVKNASDRSIDNDDEPATPAPSVLKMMFAKSTKSKKSGVKRKSFFGIPFGRKNNPVAVQ